MDSFQTSWSKLEEIVGLYRNVPRVISHEDFYPLVHMYMNSMHPFPSFHCSPTHLNLEEIFAHVNSILCRIERHINASYLLEEEQHRLHEDIGIFENEKDFWKQTALCILQAGQTIIVNYS